MNDLILNELVLRVVETIPYSVIIVEPSTWKIKYLNGKVRETFQSNLELNGSFVDFINLVQETESNRQRLNTLFFENILGAKEDQRIDELEVHFLTDHGDKVSMLLSGVYLAGEDLILVFLKDISEYKEMNQALHQLTLLDPLTGAYNRRGFSEYWSNELTKEGSQFAFLLIDIDDFKFINDEHGHDVGDNVLRIICARLKSIVRAQDFIFRLGGDEFGVIINSLEHENLGEKISILCHRILKLLANKLEYQGLSLNIGASIGCSYYPSQATSEKELINRADQALYQVKKNGKNNWALFN